VPLVEEVESVTDEAAKTEQELKEEIERVIPNDDGFTGAAKAQEMTSMPRCGPTAVSSGRGSTGAAETAAPRASSSSPSTMSSNGIDWTTVNEYPNKRSSVTEIIDSIAITGISKVTKTGKFAFTKLGIIKIKVKPNARVRKKEVSDEVHEHDETGRHDCEDILSLHSEVGTRHEDDII